MEIDHLKTWHWQFILAQKMKLKKIMRDANLMLDRNRLRRSQDLVFKVHTLFIVYYCSKLVQSKI